MEAVRVEAAMEAGGKEVVRQAVAEQAEGGMAAVVWAEAARAAVKVEAVMEGAMVVVRRVVAAVAVEVRLEVEVRVVEAKTVAPMVEVQRVALRVVEAMAVGQVVARAVMRAEQKEVRWVAAGVVSRVTWMEVTQEVAKAVI